MRKVGVLLVLVCLFTTIISADAFAQNYDQRWLKADAKISRVNIRYAADGSLDNLSLMLSYGSSTSWMGVDLNLTEASVNRLLSQILTAYSLKSNVALYLKSGQVTGIELR